jgi:polyisoprenyl-phosphate glycosyltransferase
MKSIKRVDDCWSLSISLFFSISIISARWGQTYIIPPVDTGDFRLIDRKVRDQLVYMRERSRFVRGLVSWVGFKQTAVEYEREERFAGETKYPLKKMIRFSLDGITSFSYKPLKVASLLGFFFSASSVFGIIIKTIYAFEGGGMGVAFNGDFIVQRRYVYDAWRDGGIYRLHL